MTVTIIDHLKRPVRSFHRMFLGMSGNLISIGKLFYQLFGKLMNSWDPSSMLYENLFFLVAIISLLTSMGVSFL